MDLNLLDELEKTKSSLKFRILFFFVFFLLAVFAVFVITSVLQANTVTQFLGFRYALPAVEKAIEVIDAEAFQQLTKTMDDSDPYYIETQQKLLEIKEEANVTYLYTMAQQDRGMFIYVIDGSDVPGGEDFSALGDEEDISLWDRAALRSFNTGTLLMGTIDQSEEWGALISAYAPIINDAGEVIGLLACDIDATEIVNWIRTQVIWQLGIVLVLIVVGLAVYLGVIKMLNKSFSLIIGSEENN